MAGEAALTLSNFDDQLVMKRVLETLPRSFHYRPELFVEGHVHRWAGSVNGLPSGNPGREPDSRHVPDPVENQNLLVVGDYLFDSTLNGVFDSASTVVAFILDGVPEATPHVVV